MGRPLSYDPNEINEETGLTIRQERVRDLIPSTPSWSKTPGRPQFGEEHFAAMEAALKLDCTIDEACKIAGMNRQTYYKYYRKYKEFRERMDRARDYPKILARAAVMKAIDKGDAKLALRYLNLRDKRYVGNGEAPVEEGEQANNAPVVQFISVKATKGEQTNDQESYSQMNIEQKSSSDTSVTILESNSEPDTTWKNEAEILERLDSLSSSNE